MEKTGNETLTQLISFRSFIFGLFLAILVYFILMIYSGWEDLITNIISVNVLIILLAMFLSLMNYIFRFMKWQLFTQSLSLDIPMKDNFLIFLAGLCLSITPAKAGEAIRAFLLREKSSAGLSEGLASTFSERLIDLLAVTLLALFGIFVLESPQQVNYIPVLIIILFGIIIGVLIFLFDPLFNLFRFFFWLKPWSRLGPKIDKFRSDVIATFRYDIFLIALAFGIVGWSCEGLAFFLIAENLGITITIEIAIFIYATSSLLGAISFLPGGLGVMEGSMELFLREFLIISTATAGALIILIRLTTLWFGIGLGLIVLFFMAKSLEKNKDTSNNIG